VAAPVVAYVGNVGGFKTWLDNAFRPAQGQTPNILQQPVTGAKGKTVTPSQAETDILNILKGSTSTVQNCRHITDPKTGKVYTTWRSAGCYPAGVQRTSLEAGVEGTDCNAARSLFLKTYSCNQAKHAFAYEGFDNVSIA
jgi:hypothetical protein